MKARNIVELMCQEVVELVTEYLSHTMSPEDQVRLEQHLLACPPCTAYLAQVRTTTRLVRELGQDGVAASVDEDLLTQYRRLQRK
jgi:predicted anti-sigma-YlaC factor YlaD